MHVRPRICGAREAGPGTYIDDESQPGRIVAEQWDEKGLVQRVVLELAAKIDPSK